MQHCKTHQNLKQQGFTILEALLTTVILSIGVWGCMLFMQGTAASATLSDRQVIAHQLATEELESIQADKATLGYSNILEANYPTENLTGAYAGFQRSVAVSEVDTGDVTTESPGSGIKRIEVTVSWGSGDSAAEVKLTTLIADY